MMLKRLFNKFSGIESFDELLKDTEQLYKKSKSENNSFFNEIDKEHDMERYEDWLEFHKDKLKNIADCKTKYDQIISLRKELIKTIEDSAKSTEIFNKDFTNEERILLTTKLYKFMEYDETLQYCKWLFVYSQASMYCLRYIESEYENVGKNDWFVCYKEIYPIYIKQLYYEIINLENNNKTYRPSLYKQYDFVIKEAKKKILSGENWIWETSKCLVNKNK